VSGAERPLSGLAVLTVREIVRAARRLRLRRLSLCTVKHGKPFVIGAKAHVISPNRFVVGDSVYIGRNFHCEVDAEIKNNTLISSSVSFVGNDHEFDEAAQSVAHGARLPPSKVILEGNNLIGYGSTIVGNVTIGWGCIVGAGSLVTKDLPPNMVCVGRPARPIRQRGRSDVPDLE
jgi:chloramphenicol O-acetyltransferase type B